MARAVPFSGLSGARSRAERQVLLLAVKANAPGAHAFPFWPGNGTACAVQSLAESTIRSKEARMERTDLENEGGNGHLGEDLKTQARAKLDEAKRVSEELMDRVESFVRE